MMRQADEAVIYDAPLYRTDLPKGVEEVPRKLWEASGVYFLIKNGAVIYIGSSVNCIDRVRSHRASKDFDEAFYLAAPVENIKDLEHKFIREYRPIGNYTYSEKTGNRKFLRDW